MFDEGQTPTGAYTEKVFGYSNSDWGDQLTSVNNNQITYDEIGNPIHYYNGYTFAWGNGSELTSVTNGTNAITYTYNDAGIRTSKTVNGVTHTYLLNGTQILGEEVGDHLYLYLYDAEGAPLGIQYCGSSFPGNKKAGWQLTHKRVNHQPTDGWDFIQFFSEFGMSWNFNSSQNRKMSILLKTNSTDRYEYSYTVNGNIEEVKKVGGNKTSYAYDQFNQLIRENNQEAGKTWVWTYDNAGNILTRKEYDYTTSSTLGPVRDSVSYAYGNATWGDLLTFYDGQAITYDEIGNPLTFGDWTYTWEHGRQLASVSDGDTTWTYTYSSSGVRRGRTNGTDTYEYVYADGQLKKLTVNNIPLYFSYDAQGRPMSVKYSGHELFYVLNIQGDVLGVVDIDDRWVVKYTYDAWGNILSIDGDMKDTLGVYNPLRYRGYVYDTETGLYYLQSRYYNPEIGRFINADTFLSTGQDIQGNNMFAYCGNNPIVREDFTGEFWDTVFDVASLVFSVVEVVANPTDVWAWAGLAGDVVDLIPFVSGVGETTKAIGAAINISDNVIDAAKAAYRSADASSDLRKAYGSYEVIYKSGKNYVGKGSYQRAINSAERYVKKYGDEVMAITWKSAPSEAAAYIDEFYRMTKRGVNNANTYNKI